MCFTKPKNHFCLLKFAENSSLAVIGVSEQKLTMSKARSENTPCERLAWHSAHVINQREDLKGSSSHTTPVKLLMFDFFGGWHKERQNNVQPKNNNNNAGASSFCTENLLHGSALSYQVFLFYFQFSFTEKDKISSRGNWGPFGAGDALESSGQPRKRLLLAETGNLPERNQLSPVLSLGCHQILLSGLNWSCAHSLCPKKIQ